ncbi:hypothetical protein GCM10010431_04740 [Streptomyces kunmingensis]
MRRDGRHGFHPGRLIAGVAVVVAAVVYLGDAGGAWDAPWFVGIPVVCGGLGLAGAVGTVAQAVRLRRRGADADAG